MNYIGSKYRLLEPILGLLSRRRVPSRGIAVDPFCGTGAVAAALKTRGHRVIAGDWQYYAAQTAHALLCLDAPPRFEALTDLPDADRTAPAFSASHRTQEIDGPAAAVLCHLERLPGRDGAFSEAYAEGGAGGRLYFSRENGRRIQAIRDRIEAWRQDERLSADEYAWLVASLIESADRVANTASVYGAYLKRVKATAKRPLRLVGIAPQPGAGGVGHEAHCCDANDLLERFAAERPVLTYIDPPYNHRQYAGNYHILETIARWDLTRFEPRGVSGLRPRGEQSSPYCRRTEAGQAFDRLFAAVASEWLLFSYNNEGLLDQAELERLIGRYFEIVDFEELRYPRFRADRDRPTRRYRADETVEFLVLGRRR